MKLTDLAVSSSSSLPFNFLWIGLSRVKGPLADAKSPEK